MSEYYALDVDGPLVTKRGGYVWAALRKDGWSAIDPERMERAEPVDLEEAKRIARLINPEVAEKL